MLVRVIVLTSLVMLASGCKSNVHVMLGKSSSFSFSGADKQSMLAACSEVGRDGAISTPAKAPAVAHSVSESAQRRTFTNFAMSLSQYVRISVDAITVECSG